MYWRVVWNMCHHSVGNIIIPTDFDIFQRDWLNHQPDVDLAICSHDFGIAHYRNGNLDRSKALTSWSKPP